ncbi:DUF2934 domain-containing protein [Lichenibacterium dinghuense]|uniref:DUF2934 domain-containing protein n=1 Tax=Lichenibacterium dinghuense TaxID=2895977 RepID=UPI001F1F3BA4|nr:DUF2934 domain-containing protein [Lichenibacterium sp. 6Y81]
MATIDQNAVRARAYQLWEEGGCVHGSHEEHWRRAEAECAAEGDGAGATTLAGLDGDGAAVLSGPDEAAPPAEPADATSGIDGEISRPLIDVKSKPRRWPTPIVDV